MNTNLKRFFSLSVIDSESLNRKQDKFDVVKCPRKEIYCKEQLSFINKIYVDSEFFRSEKDYKNSIETLKNAFYITTELTENPCTKCAEVFRSTVIDSLENIHYELKKITSGFFGNKNYQSSLNLAEKVLSELKSFNLHDQFHINNGSGIRFLDNNYKRKIS
jgi:hypothetical protein